MDTLGFIHDQNHLCSNMYFFNTVATKHKQKNTFKSWFTSLVFTQFGCYQMGERGSR